VRFAFIAQVEDANQATPRSQRIPINRVCRLLGVSRSGYYAWRSRPVPARVASDADLTRRLAKLHQRHKRRYGLRRLDAMLRRGGRCHSRRRLRRLARAVGIWSVHPRARTTTTVQGAARAGLVDLVMRDFVPDASGQVVYSDITYIPTRAEGFVYLALFHDAHSRRIVGWDVAAHMRTSLVTGALAQTIADLQPEPGQLIVHADRGSQYTSTAFRDACFDAGIIPSVGSTGSCYDNAQAEALNATVKKELINLRTWENLAEVRAALFEYIEIDYNRDRIQQALGYLTPVEYETKIKLEFVQAA